MFAVYMLAIDSLSVAYCTSDSDKCSVHLDVSENSEAVAEIPVFAAVRWTRLAHSTGFLGYFLELVAMVLQLWAQC